MYCFLCDRPAAASIRVMFRDGKERQPWRPTRPPHETLDVCVDCVRRVEKVEFHLDGEKYVVHMRSLT